MKIFFCGIISFFCFFSSFCQEVNLTEEKQEKLIGMEDIQSSVSTSPEELVDSPTIEEAKLSEATVEVKVNQNIALIGAEVADKSEVELGMRSKALKIYAVLLILLVTCVRCFASLFTSKANSQ